MIQFKLEPILAFVQSKYADAKLQPETGQVLLMQKIHEADCPTFLRLVEQGEMLQILTFLPLKLKEKTLPDLARVLHLINKEIDIPGFGIDEESQVMFYRTMLPSSKQKIDEEVLEAYLGSIKMLLETFFPMIMAVNEGIASFKEVLKKVLESKTQK